MDLNLKDKVVIVTGSCGMEGSIGHTIAFSLAKEGAIPVLIDRNSRGYDYEKQLRDLGRDSHFFQTDLTNVEEIKGAISKVKETYGRVDAIVNNVGVNDGVSLESDIELFVDSLKLNLISYYAVVKFALPMLKESKGNILNIGSKVALTGQGGTSGYAAAKGGVLALTREWAVDLISDGIRSNAIIIAESYTPAYEDWIQTLKDGQEKLNKIKQSIPFENRMTTPEEIANTCMFLISDKSSHTTGQFVFVDGGYVHLDRALLSN